jgi:multisubunit Na+/H+ antiporter MnhG subunit
MAIVATNLFESFGVRGPALMGAFFGLLGAITITRYQRVMARN